MRVPITLEERANIKRIAEPITIGVPFPKGLLGDPASLQLRTDDGARLPLQTQLLSRWSDGSVKWLLVDFQAAVNPKERKQVWIERMLNEPTGSEASPFVIHDSPLAITVETGAYVFTVNRECLKPFNHVRIDGVPVVPDPGTIVRLIDATGGLHRPWIQESCLEARGPVRTTICLRGVFAPSRREQGLARFVARLSFYAWSGLVELRVTIQNPRAARHKSGLWDLGDPGSIVFRDLSLEVPIAPGPEPEVAWITDALEEPRQATQLVEIYQESSGGDRWNYATHLNRMGVVPQTFRGYQVDVGGRPAEAGNRATPIVVVTSGEVTVTGTVEQFWQQFPKAAEGRENRLALRLFPARFSDGYELQGGEQKTHACYLWFGRTSRGVDPCRWVQYRVQPVLEPSWVASTQAVRYLLPRAQHQDPGYVSVIETAVAGEQAFAAKREVIDEYGWRHFGEVYADHESVGRADHPRVSHYNNQYDVIHGALIQYLSSGNPEWYELAAAYARHVVDVDIYHTDDDCPAYNGGLFWHTDHYKDAGTATHRSYSRRNSPGTGITGYGGGPCNEHNYTSGLLHYYYLSGDSFTRDTVLGLADWVIGMDDGSKRWLGWLDRRPTGKASSTADRAYHGPGRGAGNSINALLDAYALTFKDHYLQKAEELIRRCIHPHDEIRKHRLEDVEHRWSYTVFLEVLGKYLDLKVEAGRLDWMYAYGRASLLHYAAWMIDHEVPYKQVLDRVEIPTETWPAQDMRKAHVFDLAAAYADEPMKTVYLQQAEYYFQASLKDLLSFETWRFTRPLAILLTSGYAHAYAKAYRDEAAPQPPQEYDFGRPQTFKPQFDELCRLRAWLSRTLQHVQDKLSK